MRRSVIQLILAILVLVWGVWLYYGVYNYEWFKALYYSLSLFFANIEVPSNMEATGFKNIYFPAILAIGVVVWAIVELYIKYVSSKVLRWKKLKSAKYVVIGLGAGNRAYIDSELKDNNSDILVIESDANNPYIRFYDKKVLVKIADASKMATLEELDIANKKHIVISVGKDIDNINIAKQILLLNSEAKIFLHLNDRNLRDFNKKNGVLDSENIRVFSYYEESARELFAIHNIDGKEDIIHSNKPYSIAVVGNTPLAKEVIAQACIVGQLPNENLLKIYCISSDIKSFKNELELEFLSINSIPNIELFYIEANYKDKGFYNLDIWQKGITNIILCNSNDQVNLDIAISLTNTIFLKEVVDNTLKTKIHIAISNNSILSKDIDSNDRLYKHMFIFAQTEVVSNKEFILGINRDALAQRIDFLYNNVYPTLIDYKRYEYKFNVDYNKYLEFNKSNWQKLSYFQKESNRAVADHLKTKLKYLNLSIKKSNLDKEVLFKNNLEIFNKQLSNKLVKLATSEHNRWMAFHYLNGFMGMDFISLEDKKERKQELEDKKLHMCLIPFSDFKQRHKELEELGYSKGHFEGYDIMIVKFIPHILSDMGYELYLE